MTVASIAESLYAEVPKTTLYHYTTLEGLLAIVKTRSLYATEIQYFNDASEMRHVAERLQLAATSRASAFPKYRRMYDQFAPWIMDRLVYGHMLYVSCFSENGNLLSQWRAYCGDGGSGVSLGFDAAAIQLVARQHSFSVGRCEYKPERHRDILADVLVAVETLSDEMGKNADTSKRQPEDLFVDVFKTVEADLLRIAVLLKDASFKEEVEWRVVTMLTTQANQPIDFRPAKSMLVPFVPFSLPIANEPPPTGLGLERVFVGPTPHVRQSVTSVRRFLTQNLAVVRNGVEYCDIPFRTL